ncbi:MAG: DNA polymerase III subunit alpha [Alphaproteobacteria bacterium]|nr:DNA polymerase III subunit alpha [Alphaproteobacteria bacterium]
MMPIRSPIRSSAQPERHAVLGCYSNFTFLKGASHPDEMVAKAATLGWAAIGIADVNSLAGIVRAHVAARDHQIRLIVGARLRPVDGPDILVHPLDRAGYEGLSMLLSEANMRGSKAAPILYLADIARLPASTALLVMPPRHPDAQYQAHLQTIQQIAKGHLFAGLCLYRDGADEARCQMLMAAAAALKLRVAAAADALYHSPDRRPLADVLTCIREKKQLDNAGYLLSRNAERHLIDCDEAVRRWRQVPEALDGARALADLCHFSMDDLSYEYPDELAPGGRTAMQELTYHTWQGAKKRFPDGVDDRVKKYLQHELALIEKLQFAPYFLTVFDIVRFARGRGILCQGRGSAANSAVCYCLGITAVDPARSRPLFERFVSEARGEPPDIDVDFEHERREEVIQYIYAKYGRNRAGLAASVITYRRRSAFREVAKVFGLSRDVQAALAGEVWGREKTGLDDNALAAAGLDAQDRRLRLVLQLVADISRFPRHLSQHVGGFVITRGRLDHLCPISPAAMAGRTVIEWDKDDLDALGLLKVDVLALGMLSCIRRCFDLLRVHYNRTVTLASVPPEDAVTYDMLCRGQSVGVFQVESRAQMAMLPRLQPRCFHDLVVQVAIVRPGPIQGDMVHPYLRRRAGLEKVDYPSPALREVLERTLGVPLFQEQAMQIAIVGAGFSGSEADQLRRAMATFKKQGDIGHFREKMVTGMIERGYDEDFALRCFRQIEGFGTYGFPESHAASFALLVYVSAWLKCHYPDIFICALLNAQPMGFYAPSQLIAEARRSGIAIRPVDVNFSGWDHRLETDPDNKTGHHALRLGLRLVKGLPRGEGERIAASQVIGNHAVKGRQGLTFSSLDDVMRKADVSAKSLQAIADADGFSSLDMDRRQALWAARGLARHRLHDMPLFAHAGRQHERLAGDEPVITLPKTPLGEAVAEDYRSLGLSLKAHPLDLLAKPLGVAGWQLCSHVQQAPDGKRLRIAGLVTMRQRPGTASGTVFITLEDGQGTANVIIWPKLTETYREALLRAQILGLVGRVQRQQAVVHFIAESLFNLNGFLRHIDASTGTKGAVRMKSRDFH